MMPQTTSAWSRIKQNWAPWLAFGLVGLQLATALLLPGSGEHEIYPFFKWDLFPNLSRHSTDFELTILQINETVLEKPMLMSRATHYFPLTGYYEGNIVLQEYGHELVSDHPRDLEKYKDLLERDYLGNGSYMGAPVHHLVYHIDRTVYDPVKRAKHIENFISREPIGDFNIEW